jgi:nanoRNase/pAp phosphatase (c-di-AMP/oligoRNAs hydrolase)
MDEAKKGTLEKVMATSLDCLTKALENCDDTAEVAIFTHKYPDPDAIASMMALKWPIQQISPIKIISLIYDGTISHPQNQVMDNLLEPNMTKVEEITNLDRYTKFFLVDTIPSNAGIGQHKIDFDLVIDHHKEPAEQVAPQYYNIHAGSCAATIYQLIKHHGKQFDEDLETDQRIATAILVGIATDTEVLCSPETTTQDVHTWSELLDKRNPSVLQRIIKYGRPKLWVETKAAIIPKVQIHDGLAIVGIGMFDSKHRDLISDIADDIKSWDEVHTAIVFAMLDGETLAGSIRSTNSGISVPSLCKTLGSNKRGQGGGKPGKGAYSYPLGGCSIEKIDDEEIAKKTWELFEMKESNRILKTIQE